MHIADILMEIGNELPANFNQYTLEIDKPWEQKKTN